MREFRKLLEAIEPAADKELQALLDEAFQKGVERGKFEARHEARHKEKPNSEKKPWFQTYALYWSLALPSHLDSEQVLKRLTVCVTPFSHVPDTELAIDASSIPVWLSRRVGNVPTYLPVCAPAWRVRFLVTAEQKPGFKLAWTDEPIPEVVVSLYDITEGLLCGLTTVRGASLTFET